MKKNVLALSIAAAVVGFGFAGGAQAMTGTLGGATAGSSLALNGDGVGHMLLVPYFTSQSTNATLINITNTDTSNGKAVKVRFRGAANSDDIFDFQVFLSPGDVWTANISQNANGLSQLVTTDASCTKPAKAVLNVTPFVTARLDGTLTAAQKANGTREGYIEIFNMGDIPKALAGAANVVDVVGTASAGVDATAGAAVNPLYTAIKHVNSVAPCSGTAFTNLDTAALMWDTTVAAATTPRSAGLLPPTSGLVGNWTIINTTSAAAWAGEAVAIQSVVAGAASAGNVVYWPQTGTAEPAPSSYTADPLLRTANVYKFDGTSYVADATAAVTAGYYDLPDLSTPYTAAAATPLAQAVSVTSAIAASAAVNEYLTNTSITASTDWVFSMPTRRYSVAFDYAATISATDDGRRFTDINAVFAGGAIGTGYFLNANTVVESTTTNGNGRQVCVKGIGTKSYDREENGVTSTTAVVVSPSTPTPAVTFCGEAAVLSINNGGILATGTSALKASVAVKDLDVTYRDGWLAITTPAATAAPGGAGTVNGLPLVGASFARAFAGAQSFGTAHKHRFAR